MYSKIGLTLAVLASASIGAAEAERERFRQLGGPVA